MLGSTLRAHWPLLMLLPVRLWQCSPLLLYAVLLGSGTVKCPFTAGAELLLTLAASAWKKILSYSHAGSMFPNHCRPVSLQRGKSWITTKEQPKFSTSEYTYWVPNMGHCFIVAWVLGQRLSCNVSSFIGLRLWCQDSLVLEKLGLSLFFSPIVMQAFLKCLATECLLNLSNDSIRRT